jgi:hypothetical protein
MEFLEGVTLEDLIYSSKAPSPMAAARIAVQVCRTLEKIHSMGVIHRDLKPSNLMLVERDEREIVKILDFGISLLKGGQEYLRLTSTGAILGTPFYMAPEQARGEKEMDHRVDIYAVGAILYETLAHTPPFTGDNYNKVIIQVATEEPEDLLSVNPELPERLVEIIKKAMQKEPDERYPSAAVMAEELSAFESGITGERPAVEAGLLDGEAVPASKPPERKVTTAGTVQPVAFKQTSSRKRERMSGIKYAIPVGIALLLVIGAIGAILAIKGGGAGPVPAAAPKSPATQPRKDEAKQESVVPSMVTHSLSVFTEPADAWIEVNGTMQGTSPLTVKVQEGRVRLRIAKSGYDIVLEEFEVKKAAVKRYTLRAEGEGEPAEAEEEEEPAEEEKGGKKKKGKAVEGKPKKPPKPSYGEEVD